MIDSSNKLTFVGAGNMAKCIVGGLIKQGYPATHITLCSPTLDKLATTANEFGTNYTTDNLAGCGDADVVILATKPAMIASVCQQIKDVIKPSTLIVSVAAGVTCATMAQSLGDQQPIIRCMPNTPSLVGQGAAGLFANHQVSNAQATFTEQIMSAVGIVSWVKEEAQIDTVTAVSGSGPAYYFLIMEAMIEAAEKLGLDKDTATQLTLQTAAGAATLAQKSDVDVAELRKRVTSPNGTTEQAILSFEADDIRQMFSKAMGAAHKRSQELAKEFSQQA